ncbi:MAG TPA: hydantoinase B/oxoprolinase family protein, partial [Cellulomonas sp.]
VVNEGTSGERRYRKIDVLALDHGDVVTIRTPGGGGYGDPLERDPAAVLADVRAELVGVDAARRDYGVVVRQGATGPEADDEATCALRAELAHRRGPAREGFDLGAEREAWDEVFAPAWYDRFVAALMRLPPGQRYLTRNRLLAGVLETLPDDFPSVVGTPGQRVQAAGVAHRLLAELEDSTVAAPAGTAT